MVMYTSQHYFIQYIQGIILFTLGTYFYRIAKISYSLLAGIIRNYVLYDG